MDKNDLSPRWKYQVGRTWKFSNMQSVSISQCKSCPPHNQFGLRVGLPDFTHLATALFWRYPIHKNKRPVKND